MNGLSIAAEPGLSWYEASARQRLHALVDPQSFIEFIGPEQRQISPHLSVFGLPAQFDDGMIVGKASLDGCAVFVASQEGRFMGGSFGEVNGAKLTGLLRAAKQLKRDAILLLDTGGVRLQEANAGEIAIAEIIRALIEARLQGCKIIGVIGGRAGCYGGGGLIAGCCSALIISEHGRIGVSGPEVIETNQGIEEFDSRDRALVWRTMGGRHRILIGGADVYVDDKVAEFRRAVVEKLSQPECFDLKVLKREHERLEKRLLRFGETKDAIEIWTRLGIEQPEEIPELSTSEFFKRMSGKSEVLDGAR